MTKRSRPAWFRKLLIRKVLSSPMKSTEDQKLCRKIRSFLISKPLHWSLIGATTTNWQKTSHSLHLKSISCFFFMWSLISLLCFPENSHREHCTRDIIFVSGRVIPFFAKRTGEARGRWDFSSELLEGAVSWTGFSPIVAIRDSKSSIWKLYWSN